MRAATAPGRNRAAVAVVLAAGLALAGAACRDDGAAPPGDARVPAAAPGPAPAPAPPHPPRAASPDAPDVLVLVLDTTRADRCSLTGYDRPTTPGLDSLARESVVFDQTWTAGAWTAPAHASLFTGRLPEGMGLVTAALPMLPATVPALAEILRGEGWATACFTANPWIAPRTGLTRGFDRVDAFYAKSRSPKAADTHAAALAWMRERRAAGKRFFAFVNDMEPHQPYDPPADVSARFVPATLDAGVVADARTVAGGRTFRMSLGAEPATPATMAALSALYDGEIATLDREVTKLVESMRAAGLLERTLVVIAGDHGEGLGTHGWIDHGVYLYREMLRVPLLVRPPGGTAGRRVSDLVRLHDVFPTVLGACDVPVPEGIDGRPLLAGDLGGRVAVAAEHAPEELGQRISVAIEAPVPRAFQLTRRSVFDGRLHLLEDDGGGVELYDPAADPLETRNLAAERPDDVARLRALRDAPRR